MSVAGAPAAPIRILFVDDEVAVLQAMRLALYGMRAHWEMQFASSGAEAIALLAERTADVVVSDMRMPGMDGWELLGLVRDSHPQAIRFILSGYADMGSIMRVVGIAHQYLAKPCDSGALKAAIERAVSLRQLLQNDRLLQRVGRLGSLPGLPQTFLDLADCVRRPESTIQEIAAVVARDIAMTTNVMKVVNSAFFGARKPFTQIDRAVAYLGLDALGALVLGEGAFGNARGRTITAAQSARLIQHGQNTALLARAITRAEGGTSDESEQAFLAGMLHEIGAIVLGSLDIGEEEYFSLHAEAGAYLLGLWGFPTLVVEAVAYCQFPSRAPGTGLTLPCVIHIADRLAAHAAKIATHPLEESLESGLLDARALRDRLPDWISLAAQLSA